MKRFIVEEVFLYNADAGGGDPRAVAEAAGGPALRPPRRRPSSCRTPIFFYFTGSIQQGIPGRPRGREPVYFVRRVFASAPSRSRPCPTCAGIASPKEVNRVLRGKNRRLPRHRIRTRRPPRRDVPPIPAGLPRRKAPRTSPPIVGRSAPRNRPTERRRSGKTEKARRAPLRRPEEDPPRPNGNGPPGDAPGRGDRRRATGTVNRMRAFNQEPGLGCVISGPTRPSPHYADFPTSGKGLSPFVPAGQGSARSRRERAGHHRPDVGAGRLPGRHGPHLQRRPDAREDGGRRTATSVAVLRAIEAGIRPGTRGGDL